jgi:hypothetical protein
MLQPFLHLAGMSAPTPQVCQALYEMRSIDVWDLHSPAFTSARNYKAKRVSNEIIWHSHILRLTLIAFSFNNLSVKASWPINTPPLRTSLRI